MARVTTVNAARKDQGKCGRCGDPIPKGSPYRHASPGFRSAKKIRCMKGECSFRQSELTTSKMSEVYAAQEDAEADITIADTLDDIKIAMDCAAERCREVAQEYREAAEAMGDAGSEHEERADEIESYCDDLENFDTSEYQPQETEDDDDEQDEDDLLDQCREAAVEAVNAL